MTWKRLILFVAVCGIMNETLLSVVTASDGREGRLSSDDTFLAIDNTAFDSIDGLSLSVCEARKYSGNPVLGGSPGGPDQYRAGFCQVFLVNGKFRMYYNAFDKVHWWQCYAESKDGYHWKKPDLGIIKYKGKDSNIILSGLGLQYIFYDDKESDHDKRYKSPVFGFITDKYFNEDEKKRYGKGQPGIRCFAYSPDGIHWTQDESVLFPVHAKLEGASLYRMHGRWFIASQMSVGDYPEVNPWGRFIGISSSIDFKNWQLASHPGFFFDPEYSGFIQTHMVPVYQNYGNIIVGCEGLFRNNAELVDQETDIILLFSNDGFKWKHVTPGQPLNCVLRRGNAGSWDASFICQGGLINVGRETRLYYSGCPEGGNASGHDMKIGAAGLRLDGYGYLAPAVEWEYSTADSFSGQIISKPVLIKTKGINLYFNAKGTKGHGNILKVEIINKEGKPIPGFSLEECDDITDNSVGIPVTWNGKTSLTALAGKSVRVKIKMRVRNSEHRATVRKKSPAVYAFYFDKPTIWDGARQRIFPRRGLERVNYQDAQPNKLQGIDFRSDNPVEVITTELTKDHAKLIFSGKSLVRMYAPGVQYVNIRGKKVYPQGALFTFPVLHKTVVLLRRK